MRMPGNKQSNAAAGPEGFHELLKQCEIFPSCAGRGETDLEVSGRIFRSPNAGRFIVQPAAEGAEALEFDVTAALGFELLYQDSGGRSTHRIEIAADSRARVLARAEGRSVGDDDRPRADSRERGMSAAGVAAWESAPWRTKPRQPPETEALPAGPAGAQPFSTLGDSAPVGSQAFPGQDPSGQFESWYYPLGQTPGFSQGQSPQYGYGAGPPSVPYPPAQAPWAPGSMPYGSPGVQTPYAGAYSAQGPVQYPSYRDQSQQGQMEQGQMAHAGQYPLGSYSQGAHWPGQIGHESYPGLATYPRRDDPVQP